MLASTALTQLFEHALGGFLLRQQHQHTATGRRDTGQRTVQGPLLRPAFAFTPQHVTQRLDALHPHQHRLRAVDPALDQRQVQRALVGVLIGGHLELTVAGMQRIFAAALDRAFMQDAIVDQVGNGADPQAMPLGEVMQLGATGQLAVLVENAHQGCRRLQPRQSRQVASGLDMTGPLHHATGQGLHREDMPRLHQVRRYAGRVDRHLDRPRPVCRRDPRGHPGSGFDRAGKTHAMLRPGVGHHQVQAQRAAALLGQGQANQPARLHRHEGDGLGPGLFGSHQQRAFAVVFVVGDHHHPTGADGLDQLRHRVESQAVHLSAPRRSAAASDKACAAPSTKGAMLIKPWIMPSQRWTRTGTPASRKHSAIASPSSRNGSNSAVIRVVGGNPVRLSARSGEANGSSACPMSCRYCCQNQRIIPAESR
ncbi:hypothetical protein D3C87_1296960 [compost metagenome]